MSKQSKTIARDTLREVCGDGGKYPDSQTIVRACVPIIQGHMIVSGGEDSHWENEQIALIAKRAFCAGFVMGEDSAYEV